jgi:hypothetical protein
MMFEKFPDEPITASSNWVLMRSNHLFDFEMVSELSTGAGKKAFVISLQFILLQSKTNNTASTKRANDSTVASDRPTKIGKTIIAVKGIKKKATKVFIFVGGDNDSIEEFDSECQFLGATLKIPFDIMIDNKQDLGKKNGIEGASRRTYPSSIAELPNNIVAKWFMNI